ncbi:DNA-binding transcriptional regulator [Bacteroides sp. OttesenSCG-928-D19]|nr:DNA-binding transcriptional regulator [Bacteroides sp. OttesenSCG-928-D19]
MARIILLTDFSEEYAKNLLKGIVKYSLENTPWVLCKMPLSYREKNGVEGVLKWAKEWKADGIIAQFYNTDKVNIFKENGIVAIAQDFKDRFTEIPNITGDHHLAGRMGADYFIRKGFKNFAFYGYKNIVWSEERGKGYKDELAKHKNNFHFYEYQNEDFSELWYYNSEPLIKWLESLPKPVAMMACDDNQAHHISQVCKQCGIRIPEEISLLGVDNDEAICTLSDPPLSSLNQAVEKGGYEAAILMERIIHNPHGEYGDIVVQPTHIVTRQSTDIYSTSDKYIAVALQYIHQNSNNKITISDLTDLVPLSRRLLENRFKEVTGFPVYTYIMNLRIEKFAQKLLETNDPIIDIASDMDFIDYKNFSRQFKKIMGCNPSSYRKIHTLS